MRILVGWLLFSSLCLAANGQAVAVPNGGFETGLSPPWGTGQYSEGRPIWWNSKNCRSSAEPDKRIRRGGSASLHIINPSPRAGDIFGTTQQPISVVPNQRYRISLWARTQGLASDGAVEIVVDKEWKVRPIHLPRGSYDWTRFSGVFSLPEKTAQLRILSQDKSEAWIDDIEIEVAEVGEGSPAPEQSTSAQRASQVPLKPGPPHYFAPAKWARPISGQLLFEEVDLSLPSGFAVTRAYSADPRLSADFGGGWVANWETGIIAGAAEDRVEVFLPDLTLASMRRGSDGAYRAAGSADELRREPNGGWVLSPVAGGSIIYDDNGRPVEILSPNGAKLRYERKNGLLTKIVAPDGTVFEAVRDGSGKIRQIKSKEIWGSYVYDQNGRLTEFRCSDGWFFQYGIDNRGRLIKRADASGATTHVAYDATGRVETLGAPKSDAGASARLSFAYGPPSFSVTDEKGRTESTTSSGLTTVLKNALDEKITIQRDADGRVVHSEDARGLKMDFLFDPLGRPAGWHDSLGRKEQWHWDGPRLVETIDTLGRSRKYFYDGLGNVATETDPTGGRVKFTPATVDEQPLFTPDELKTIEEIQRRVHLNRDGFPEKIESQGRVVSWRYDAGGKPVEIAGPAGRYQLAYEAGGLLSQMTGPDGRSISFRYDAAGREIAEGSTAAGWKHFEYDLAGRLVRQSAGEGKAAPEVRFEYDALDRVTKMTTAPGGVATFAYSKDGVVREEMAGRFRRTITANAAGQIIEDKDGDGRAVEFAYDASGAPVGWKASDGWQLAVATGTSGEPTSLNFSGPGNRSLSVAFGRKSSEVVATYSNGITATSQLDASGKPIEIKWSSRKGPLFTRNYTYDAQNFLTKEQRTDVIATGPFNSQREYKYDGAGRFITTPSTKPTHQYDSAGRIATLGAADRTVHFQWDGANRLLSAEATTETPRSVQKFSFERDALGGVAARIAQDATTEIWRAAGAIHEITERNGGKVTRIRFLPSPAGNPVAFVFSDQIYVLETTPRGDVIGVAAEDGSIINHYEYDDWGAMLGESERIPQPFRFAGAYYDRQLKLYEMGERWYDPAARVFLTPDPVPSLDPYAYADGDPVNLVDPTGTTANQWLDLVDATGNHYRHWIVRAGVVMDEQALGIAQAYHAGHLAGAAEGMSRGRFIVASQGGQTLFGGRAGQLAGGYSDRAATVIRGAQQNLLRHVEGLYGRSFQFTGNSLLGTVRAGSAAPAATWTHFFDGNIKLPISMPIETLNPGGTTSRLSRLTQATTRTLASGAQSLGGAIRTVAGSPLTAQAVRGTAQAAGNVLSVTGKILNTMPGQVGFQMLTNPSRIGLDPHEEPLDPTAVELIQRTQKGLHDAGLSDKEIEEIWAHAGGMLGRTNPLHPETSVVPPSEMEKLAGASIKELSPIGPEMRSLAAIRQAQLVRGAINASAGKPGARFTSIAAAVDSTMVRRIAADASVADALLARVSYLVQQAEILLKNKTLDPAEQSAREAVANLDSLRALLAAAGKPDRTSELNGRGQAVLARIAAARNVVEQALAALESARIKAGAGNFSAARAILATALSDRSLFELAGKPEMLEHLEDLDTQVADAPGIIISIKAELQKMRDAVEKCSTLDWVGAEASAMAGFSKFEKFDFHPLEVALLKQQKDKISGESLMAAEKIADLVDKAESLEKTDPKNARTAASNAIKLAATVDAKGRRCGDILAARANALIKRLATAAPAPALPTQAATVLSGSGKVTSSGLPDKRATFGGPISSFTIDVANGTFHATGSVNSTSYYEPYPPGSPGRLACTATETVTLDGRYQGDGKTGTLVGTWAAKGTAVWVDGHRSRIGYSQPVRGKLESGTVTGELTLRNGSTFKLNVQVK